MEEDYLSIAATTQGTLVTMGYVSLGFLYLFIGLIVAIVYVRYSDKCDRVGWPFVMFLWGFVLAVVVFTLVIVIPIRYVCEWFNRFVFYMAGVKEDDVS